MIHAPERTLKSSSPGAKIKRPLVRRTYKDVGSCVCGVCVREREREKERESEREREREREERESVSEREREREGGGGERERARERERKIKGGPRSRVRKFGRNSVISTGANWHIGNNGFGLRLGCGVGGWSR